MLLVLGSEAKSLHRSGVHRRATALVLVSSFLAIQHMLEIIDLQREVSFGLSLESDIP